MTFEQFAVARIPSLLRYAVVLTGDRELAQDVVQEVLARAQVRWRRISEADSPEAYVRRMVLNEYLSWRRTWAARNVHAVGERLVDLDDARGGVQDHADDVVESDELWNRLSTLGRKQRAVLVLRYYEQLEDTAIADPRVEAQLAAFFGAGYDWDDAVKLAKLWHKADPYQAKVEGGKRLLAGQTLPIQP